MSNHHLIFEGAELAGKSWLMSQVYDHLEPKYNQSGFVLDGCHWFNCDVGIFGTGYGQPVIADYLKIFSTLADSNLLVEKFHLSDIVYNRLHRQTEIDYDGIEQSLKELGFRIVLVGFPEDEKLLQRRLEDRLNLYPHYGRIAHDPMWYIKQQQEYMSEIGKSRLPHLAITAQELPDQALVDEILHWIGEK